MLDANEFGALKNGFYAWNGPIDLRSLKLPDSI